MMGMSQKISRGTLWAKVFSSKNEAVTSYSFAKSSFLGRRLLITESPNHCGFMGALLVLHLEIPPRHVVVQSTIRGAAAQKRHGPDGAL